MSKKRLIDARYQDKNLKWWLDTNTENGVVRIPEYVVKKCLEQSSIDPETLPLVQELRAKLAECEPVHAHWEPFSENENRGYRCSHCKKARISNSDYYSTVYRNYCYNCGAKMRKEEINVTL